MRKTLWVGLYRRQDDDDAEEDPGEPQVWEIEQSIGPLNEEEFWLLKRRSFKNGPCGYYFLNTQGEERVHVEHLLGRPA